MLPLSINPGSLAILRLYLPCQPLSRKEAEASMSAKTPKTPKPTKAPKLVKTPKTPAKELRVQKKNFDGVFE